VTAGGRGNHRTSRLERLNRQFEAVQRGIFVGEGRNDVPYSQQRMDEVTIQLAELFARERDQDRDAQVPELCARGCSESAFAPVVHGDRAIAERLRRN
jgi:hypothetical protein